MFNYLSLDGGLFPDAESLVAYYDAVLVIEALAESLLLLLFAPYFAGEVPLCDFAFSSLRVHPEPSRAHRTAAQNASTRRNARSWSKDVSPVDADLYSRAKQQLDRARRVHDRRADRSGAANATALRAALGACPEPGAPKGWTRRRRRR